MINLMSVAQMRKFDSMEIKKGQYSASDLMEIAADGIVSLINEINIGKHKRIVIVCGPGNNGGDGISAFWKLSALQYDCTCVSLLPDSSKLNETSRFEYSICESKKLPVIFDPDCKITFDNCIVIDALFGTGLSKIISGSYLQVIHQINSGTDNVVVSVDIPSGISGDTGCVLGEAVKADYTITFQNKKPGLSLSPGRFYCGNIKIHRIAKPHEEDSYYLFEQSSSDTVSLPWRKPYGHKGCNGHALIAAGSERYPGALLMCLKAAGMSGLGMISAVMPASLLKTVNSFPDAIYYGVKSKGSIEWGDDSALILKEVINRCDAVCIGPGIENIQSKKVFEVIFESSCPVVLDAGALNYISENEDCLVYLNKNSIITPHPGEMARLLKTDIADVLNDYIGASMETAKRFGCIVVLKGASSCISNGHKTVINTTGNDGLAKGGSGDVLSGIIVGLLSQGMKPFEAACAGCYLLGTSAEKAFEALQTRMLLHKDIIDYISEV